MSLFRRHLQGFHYHPDRYLFGLSSSDGAQFRIRMPVCRTPEIICKLRWKDSTVYDDIVPIAVYAASNYGRYSNHVTYYKGRGTGTSTRGYFFYGATNNWTSMPPFNTISTFSINSTRLKLNNKIINTFDDYLIMEEPGVSVVAFGNSTTAVFDIMEFSIKADDLTIVRCLPAELNGRLGFYDIKHYTFYDVANTGTVYEVTS